MGHPGAELQPVLRLLDVIELGDCAQMDHIGDLKARFHSVHDIDAASHVHRARAGCRLHRYRLGGTPRTVQPELRDQLARPVHREPRGSGKRSHMTPPTGISPPYHRGSPIHQARRCRTGRNRCRRGARSPPAPSPSRRPKRNRRCPLLPTKPMPRLTPGRAPTRASWVDLMAACSRNPAAPRNAVSPWEAGAPRSAASRWEAAANPWLGAIARCSRTGSSNPSPSSGESTNFRFLLMWGRRISRSKEPGPDADGIHLASLGSGGGETRPRAHGG